MRNRVRAQVAIVLLALAGCLVPAGSATAAPSTAATASLAASASPVTEFGVTTPGGLRATGQLDQVTRVAGAAPSIVMAYSDFAHPLDVAGLDAVAARGATPMITWEPWVWGGGVNQPAYSLAKITSGSFDGYVRTWARGLRSWGKPVYLRFAHEMNGDWYPWSERVNGNRAGDYVAAWRHVRAVFEAQKVTNVRWVWSPNVTYPGSLDLPGLYPGSSSVDVVAVDGYNWGTAASWSIWTSPGELFDPTVRQLRTLAPGKTIMLAEVASAEQGGSKAAWVTDLFTWLRAQGDVRAFIWFDQAKEADWRIDSSDSAASAFAAGLSGLRS
ncbi:MAG TPA: glycosyl hydrolase [Actinomycetales bacterium]|nr:glycosyl hydrolase [Actinomycetales bacterium]